VVISDRYVDSSLAYQGAGRTLPVQEISWLSAWATGGLKPDLVVLLDVDPGVGLSRVDSRGQGTDRLESESRAFHERVRYAFLDLAAADPKRYLVLDAARPPTEIADTVTGRLTTLLGAAAAPHPAPTPASGPPVSPVSPVSPGGEAPVAGSPAQHEAAAAAGQSGPAEDPTPPPLEEIAEVLGIDDEAPADPPHGARP
jgi:dTMP kinase